ncbi:MAG: ethanolamine utilization protein EutH [Lachnospiraceae bacterium]|nr:ethanolamine utilization protein EutH [Lachnospiraceae bacterium]
MEYVLSMVMMIFMAIAAVDQMFLKGKLGLGSEMERGIAAMGPLVLSMAGIMCIAPVLGRGLETIVAPLFRMLGVDPAMTAGMLFAVDMGGLPLAQAMTENQDIIMLSGVILSTTMGVTIVFTIPVVLGICRKEDMKEILMGIVIGIISVPFGLIAGSMAAGIPLSFTIANSFPVLILCIVLAVVLLRFPDQTLVFFQKFGVCLNWICLISLVIAAVEEKLGIVVIPGMDPLGEQLKMIGIIGITLAGAYPFVAVLKRILAPALKQVGKILGVGEIAVAGMLACLANAFLLFDMLKDMDRKGKIVAMAFVVPSMGILGAHLGYVSAAMPEGVVPMVAAKVTAGVTAVILAEGFTALQKPGKSYVPGDKMAG